MQQLKVTYPLWIAITLLLHAPCQAYLYARPTTAFGRSTVHAPIAQLRIRATQLTMSAGAASSSGQEGGGAAATIGTGAGRVRRGGGTASLPVSSINLVKNMVGAGVFSLNAKVSAISSSPKMLLPASLLVLTMAIWAAYNFYMVGETCEMTNSKTYGEAWGATVSESSRWLVQAVVVISPIVSCLASTIVLTDILSLVMRAAGAPAWLHGNRNAVIALLSSVILYPLCIMKDLSALRSVSAFGILGHFSAMLALAVRLADKSYFAGGKYFAAPVVAAATAAKAGAVLPKVVASAAPMSLATIAPKKVFVLASLLSYCFVCHYNAPRYYDELQDKDKVPNQFVKLASISYSAGSIIYITTMALGLHLFGPQSASFALNSFSTKDPLGTLARIAFGSSVLASFPLIFLSMRNWFVARVEGITNKLPKSAARDFVSSTNGVSAALLLFVSLLASKYTDIGVVGSVSGAIFGSSMMFIFPPIMYTRALILEARKDGKRVPLPRLAVNAALLLCGALMGIFGTINTLRR